jgi:hypothetical protein
MLFSKRSTAQKERKGVFSIFELCSKIEKTPLSLTALAALLHYK